MNNNDILRRLRYTFDYKDSDMIEIFGAINHSVTRSDVSDWLKRDEDPDFKKLSDTNLAIFLNGLIISRRGKKDGPLPVPEKSLNNNIIFRKIRIALDLKAEDILEIMKSVDYIISKHELSAFFRKKGHKHYRDCQDQVLRNFLTGVQKKHRK